MAKIPIKPEGMKPYRRPEGYVDPTHLPDSVRGVKNFGNFDEHTANLPAAFSIRGQERIYTEKMGSLNISKTGQTWNLPYQAWGETVAGINTPGKKSAVVTPGVSHYAVTAQWGTPLAEASYYTQAKAGYVTHDRQVQGKGGVGLGGIPSFVHGRSGAELEQTRYASLSSILLNKQDGVGKLSLRLPIETTEGRMLMPRGGVRAVENIEDPLGLLHRFDARLGYNPVSGQRLSAENFSPLLLTSQIQAAVSEAGSRGERATLGRYISYGGKNVQLRGSVILRQGKGGFYASGGRGIIGGEYLARTSTQAVISSPHALGRGVVGAIDDLHFDFGRGMELGFTELEYANTIGSMIRQVGGTYQERARALNDLDKMRLMAGPRKLADILEHPKQLATRTPTGKKQPLAAIYDRFLGPSWEGRRVVPLQTMMGEFWNNLAAFDVANKHKNYNFQLYDSKGSMSMATVYQKLRAGGVAADWYGKDFFTDAGRSVAIAQGLSPKSKAFAQRVAEQARTLENQATWRIANDLGVGRTMASYSATVMAHDRGFRDLMKRTDSPYAAIFDTFRRIQLLDTTEKAAGETNETLIASLVESMHGGMFSSKAALHDDVARRRAGLVTHHLFVPGSMGEETAQGWLSTGKGARRYANYVPGLSARLDWDSAKEQNIGFALGRVFQTDTAARHMMVGGEEAWKNQKDAGLPAYFDDGAQMFSRFGLEISGKSLSLTSSEEIAAYHSWARLARGKDGRNLAVMTKPGSPLSLKAISLGLDVGRQVEASNAAIHHTLKDVQRLWGHRIFETSGASEAGRVPGSYSLFPTSPTGLEDVPKNVERHLQEGIWPVLPRELSRHASRTSFMMNGEEAGQRRFGKFSRGNITARTVLMSEGWTSTDAAMVARWFHEKVSGAQVTHTPILGTGTFQPSPTLLSAASISGRNAGGTIELGFGTRGENRLSVAMGWYVAPGKVEEFSKTAISAHSAAQDLAVLLGQHKPGKELAELEAKWGFKTRPWMREAAARGLDSSHSMIETGILDQLVRAENLGSVLAHDLAPNQRLYLEAYGQGQLKTLTQSYNWTKATTTFGSGKALIHGVIEGLRYDIPYGDLESAAFRPLAGKTAYQQRQATSAIYRTRNLLEQMHVEAIVPALPDNWALPHWTTGSSEWSTMESWATRGWRGKVFSADATHWGEAIHTLKVKPGKAADEVMSSFGARYLSTYQGTLADRLRRELGEATVERTAAAEGRGLARLAMGLGASEAEAVGLAKGLTDTVSGPLGKIHRSELTALDAMFRERTALDVFTALGGDLGARGMHIDPYDPRQMLAANLRSHELISAKLDQPELGGLGHFEQPRFLRQQIAFQAVNPLVKMEVHVKSSLASTGKAHEYTAITTELAEMGMGTHWLRNPKELAKLNSKLEREVGGTFILGGVGVNPSSLRWNWSRADGPGELAAGRAFQLQEILKREKILAASWSFSRDVVGTVGIDGRGERSVAMAAGDVSYTATEFVNSGIGAKSYSELNRKDLLLHHRLNADIAKRLTVGKNGKTMLSAEQASDFATWFLQRHIIPSERTNQFKIFMAGVTDMERFGEITASRKQSGQRIHSMFQKLRTPTDSYVGMPEINIAQTRQKVLEGLQRFGRGTMVQATPEEIYEASKATLGRDLSMGMRLNVWDWLGAGENRAETYGDGIVETLRAGLTPILEKTVKGGDKSQKQHVAATLEGFLSSIKGFFDSESNPSRFYEWHERPNLADPSKPYGRHELRALIALQEKHPDLTMDTSRLYIGPFAGEDSVFKTFEQGAEGRLSKGANYWASLMKLSESVYSVFEDPEFLDRTAAQLAQFGHKDGDKFYKSAMHTLTTQPIELGRKVFRKLETTLSGLAEVHIEAAEGGLDKAVGAIASMRAYLAPMMQQDKLLQFMEELKAKGIYDIHLGLTGEDSIVSKSAIQLGYDQAERVLHLQMHPDTYEGMSERFKAIVGFSRQPTTFTGSHTEAGAAVHPSYANGIVGLDTSLITVHLMGDTDTDKAAMLLFGDRAKMLREWLEAQKIQGIKVADMTDQHLAGQIAMGFRKSRPLSQMLSDDLIKGLYDDGKGIFDLEQARRLTRTTLEALGYKAGEMPALELSVLSLASHSTSAWGNRIEAIASGSVATMQNQLTGLADTLMMGLPAGVEHIQGRLLEGQTHRGLEIFAEHFGTEAMALFQRFTQTTAGNVSQAFIGGKHHYKDIIDKLVPIMGLAGASENDLKLHDEHPELLQGSVTGLLNPDDYANFREHVKGLAGKYEERRAGLLEAASKVGYHEEALSALDKVQGLLADGSGHFDGLQVAKTLRELHDELANRGQISAVKDLPRASMQSYEKENKLLNQIPMKGEAASMSGVWQDTFKQFALETGGDFETLRDDMFTRSRNAIREVVDRVRKGTTGDMVGGEWAKRVFADSELQSNIMKNDGFAAKAGMTLLGPMAQAMATELRGADPEFRTPFKGPAHSALKKDVLELMNQVLPGADKKVIRAAAEQYAALAGLENYGPSAKALPVAESQIGQIIGAGLSSDQLLQNGVPVSAEAYAENNRTGASAALDRLDALAIEGADAEGTKGVKKVGGKITRSLDQVAADITRKAKQGGESGRGVAAELEQKTGSQMRSILDSEVGRVIRGLSRSPLAIGAGLVGGMIMADRLTSTGAPAPDASWGLPRLSRETLDDYDGVVDEVAPNPSPVRVTPQRSSFGMRQTQKMRMTDVDDGTLNTVGRSLGAGGDNTSLTVRDQSRTQRRWMLRREVDHHLASRF